MRRFQLVLVNQYDSVSLKTVLVFRFRALGADAYMSSLGVSLVEMLSYQKFDSGELYLCCKYSSKADVEF